MVKGYVYIYMPDHPKATKKGYVLEHRVVMEKILGRHLKDTETVHHIDGDTQNNEPTNLMLMDDECYHRKLHSKYRTRDANGRFYGHAESVSAYI